MDEIVSQPNVFRSDEKRFYLPGCVVRSKCPKCGEMVDEDLGERYLMNPHFNTTEKVHFFHDHDGSECWAEWDVDVVLILEVELAENCEDDNPTPEAP